MNGIVLGIEGRLSGRCVLETLGDGVCFGVW